MFGIGIMFREPTLGLGNAYVPKKKEWVQFAIEAAKLGANLWGLKNSMDAENSARKSENQQYNTQMGYWRRKEYDKDTAAVQALNRQQEETRLKNFRRAQGIERFSGRTGVIADTQNADSMKEASQNSQIQAKIADNQLEASKGAMMTSVAKSANDAAHTRATSANMTKAVDNAMSGLSGISSATNNTKNLDVNTGSTADSTTQTANAAGINTNQQYKIELDDILKRKGNNGLGGVWNYGG